MESEKGAMLKRLLLINASKLTLTGIFLGYFLSNHKRPELF